MLMFQAAEPMARRGASVPALVVIGFGVMILAMIWHHCLAYRRAVAVDRVQPVDLGKVMALPYLRIIPVHLSILLFGGLVVGSGAIGMRGWEADRSLIDRVAIVIFVLIKTGVDLRFDQASRAALEPARSPPSQVAEKDARTGRAN